MSERITLDRVWEIAKDVCGQLEAHHGDAVTDIFAVRFEAYVNIRIYKRGEYRPRFIYFTENDGDTELEIAQRIASSVVFVIRDMTVSTPSAASPSVPRGRP